MAGKVYHSRGDPDLLALLVVWEAEKSAARYELIEGGLRLESECALFGTPSLRSVSEASSADGARFGAGVVLRREGVLCQ